MYNTYYLDETTGVMLKGLQYLEVRNSSEPNNNAWYYFKESGSKEGSMQTGFQKWIKYSNNTLRTDVQFLY